MKTWTQAFFVLILIVALPAIMIATEIPIEYQYCNSDTEDKLYIQPNSIYFSQNQIYVRIAEDLIPIQQLSCDNNGVFILIQDIQAGRGRQETWICLKCGYENYVGINNCGLCGRDRYEKDGR